MELMRQNLARWRTYLDGSIDSVHLILARDWRFCAIGERIEKEGKFFLKEEDLCYEARVLGYDFYLSLRNHNKQRAYEILEIIEKIHTIWRT